MSEHHELARQLRIDVYFAEAHSPGSAVPMRTATECHDDTCPREPSWTAPPPSSDASPSS
jgi:hypothetical protein